MGCRRVVRCHVLPAHHAYQILSGHNYKYVLGSGAGMAKPPLALSVGRIDMRSAQRDRGVTHGARRAVSVSGGSRRALDNHSRGARSDTR